MVLSHVLMQIGDIVPHGTQTEVFDQMFWVFTGLGTLVGTVVIGYLFWKSYQYRDRGRRTDDDDVLRPQLGVLPGSGHGGRHLLVSFSISAVIVIALIGWTYGSLLYLTAGVSQNPPAAAQEQMDVSVVGHQFYWEFQYHNVSGHEGSVTTQGELRVPRDALVRFDVTSADVFHTFGIPELKVKTDAIPGQTTTTWLVADETGTYIARCYELCGSGHSFMTAQVIVMQPDEFDAWYAQQTKNATATNANSTEA